MHYTQLDNERYRVWVELEPDYTGRRRRKSKVIHARTKKELKKKIDEWTASLSPASGTVSGMVEAVWPRILQGKSPNTITKYTRERSIIDITIGSLNLDRLTPRTIQEWVYDLSASYCTGYVRALYSRLNQCCSLAVVWGLLHENPCHDVAMPRDGKKTVSIMSEADLLTFCHNLHALPPDRAVLFELALFGSLRRGEILGIYEDEIPSDGRFYIQRARYAPTVSGSYVKETKTASGARPCILPNSVVQDVEALREYHAQQKEKMGALWHDSPYLIKQPDGSPYHATCAVGQLKAYMKAIGLEPITFHGLRHTFASVCIGIGLDPATVARRMGHSKVSTTLETYTHLFARQNQRDEVSTSLDNLIQTAQAVDNSIEK